MTFNGVLFIVFRKYHQNWYKEVKGILKKDFLLDIEEIIFSTNDNSFIEKLLVISDISLISVDAEIYIFYSDLVWRMQLMIIKG